MSDRKLYNVIYADPPWDQKAGRKIGGYALFNGKQTFNSFGESQLLPYPTMSLKEIASLNITPLLNKNCHLFLWATNKYLLAAGDVIKAWGFEYSSAIVWAKNKMGGGLGGSIRISTEFLIYARRGRPKNKNVIKESWFNVKRDYVNGFPSHSKKPDFFRRLIEDFSDGPYLELFAREGNDGWDVYGNQVANSIELVA